VLAGFILVKAFKVQSLKGNLDFRAGIASSRHEPAIRLNRALGRHGVEAENRTLKEIDISEQFLVSLHHPVLVFVWSVSLLLIGCFWDTLAFVANCHPVHRRCRCPRDGGSRVVLRVSLDVSHGRVDRNAFSW